MIASWILVALMLIGVVCLFFGLSLITIAVHEAEHFFVGRAVGYDVKHCIIGPFKIEWAETGSSPKLSASGRAVSGYVQFRSEIACTRGMKSLMLLAGILANLVFGLVCLLISLLLPFGVPQLHSLLNMLGLFSLLTSLINLFPFKHRGMSTDGLQLLNLWWPQKPSQRRGSTARPTRRR